ncbi:hypothetical protein MMC06_003831 [Schaereria dolodes]|nr:hypothetical protein [Schaereria dolodes]
MSSYIADSFSEPMTALHNFQNRYDLDNPVEAMSSYARTMHQHTKRQMDSATRAARRRDLDDTSATPSYSSRSSSNSDSSSAKRRTSA